MRFKSGSLMSNFADEIGPGSIAGAGKLANRSKCPGAILRRQLKHSTSAVVPAWQKSAQLAAKTHLRASHPGFHRYALH